MLRARKNIFKITNKLMLAKKRVFSKNRILPNLSLMKISSVIMLYIFRAELFIFFMPVSINQIKKHKLAINAKLIMLILLLELIKVLNS